MKPSHNPIPKRYLLVVIALGALTLVVGAALFFIWYKPVPTQVNVTGTSTEIGTGYGHALAFRIKLVTRVYLDRIVCGGNEALIQARRAGALASMTSWPSAYTNELVGMAAAAGADQGALAYGNCFLDLGNAKVGCRSLVVATNDLFLHAHNLDWDNLGGLGRWTTCIIRRSPSDGRFQTVTIGFPGMVGALDIINAKGLALSFNQLGFGKGVVHEPVFVMMRRIAETCSSLTIARQELLHARPGMPFIITVSDAMSGEASIFERVRDQVVERKAKGWVAGCNAAQGTGFGGTRLDQLVGAAQITRIEDVYTVMSNPEVLMGSNIYSVIFDFRRNRLLIASGEVPAAAGRFREYPLFP